MPKEKRRRSGVHDQSVRLTKRQFAVQDNVVEHVQMGAQAEASGTDILKSMTEQERSRLTLKKKEKQALKHESFLKRLESSRSPYSKSHERRLKRKTRDQVAGGMGEVQAAILALEDDIPDAVINSTEEGKGKRMQVTPKVGQIGEGKGVTLSKAQRKRALQIERLRIPMILSTPEFSSSPFQTIRTHAQNTLVRHQPPQ